MQKMNKDNKLALRSYFRSNPTQRGYRKRMIDIWEEFTRFKITNKRLADQAKMIIKKDWFYNLEIFEIHQKVNKETCQLDPNTISETLNREKTEPSDQLETPHTQIQRKKHKKKKRNVEFLKRIMSEKETTLSSFRNQDRKTVKQD